MLNNSRTIKLLNEMGSFIVFAILFLSFCSGCSLPKRYVGMEVDTTNWPQYRSGEKIVFPTEAVTFEITITEAQEDGVYTLEGTMDGSRGSVKSIDHLIVHECSFSLILAYNGVVVDNISFFPQGTDHTHKLPFKRKFKTGPFDSIIIGYQLSVGG